MSRPLQLTSSGHPQYNDLETNKTTVKCHRSHLYFTAGPFRSSNTAAKVLFRVAFHFHLKKCAHTQLMRRRSVVRTDCWARRSIEWGDADSRSSTCARPNSRHGRSPRTRARSDALPRRSAAKSGPAIGSPAKKINNCFETFDLTYGSKFSQRKCQDLLTQQVIESTIF